MKTIYKVEVTQGLDWRHEPERWVVVGHFDSREAAEQACAEFEELCAQLRDKWRDDVYVEIREIDLNERLSSGQVLEYLELCPVEDEEDFMQLLRDPNQTEVWDSIVSDVRRAQKKGEIA